MASSHIVAAVVLAASTIGTVAYNARRVTDLARAVAGPYRWLKAFAQTPAAVMALREKLEAHSQTLGKIEAELIGNGGLSLKDAIGRIEANSIIDRQRSRAMLLDMPSGFFEADESGSYIWVNRTLCRLMQRLPDEILGHGWEACIGQEDREQVMSQWNRCIAMGTEFAADLRFALPCGKTTEPMHVHTYALRSAPGQVIGFLGVCRGN